MTLSVLVTRRGDRIEKTSLHEELEACVQRHREKYSSDLRTMATNLTRGCEDIAGTYIYKHLQSRYPTEHRELLGITRNALLVSEGSADYEFVPEGYVLDRSDPDILVLRRHDEEETFVAYFSPTGVTVQGILDAVREDREEELGEKD